MTVRLARAEDAFQLGPLHVESWQQAYADIIPEEFLQSLDPAARTVRFSEMIEDQASTLLVAEDDGRVAGFCSFGPSRDVEAWGEVYAIYLRSTSWGRGLGRSLLAEAEARLAEDFSRAMLWVLTDNRRARAFYERRGWVATDQRQYLDIADRSIEELRYDRDLIGSPTPSLPGR